MANRALSQNKIKEKTLNKPAGKFKKVLSVLPAVLIPIALMFFLFINPARYSAAIFNGLTVWATVVLPSLFPFLIATKILCGFKGARILTPKLDKAGRLIYRVPGEALYIGFLSFLSGCPAGAKLVADSCVNGGLTGGEAARTVSFSSVCSPLYVLGTLGSLLKSPVYAVIVLAAQYLGALLNGLIYSRVKFKEGGGSGKIPAINSGKKGFTDMLSEGVYGAVTASLTVGGFIALFFFISQAAADINLFYPLELIFGGLQKGLGIALGKGLLEMTAGCAELSVLGAPPIITILSACFITSFGGLSVFSQGMSFLKNCKIKPRYFLLVKLTHAVISTVICIIPALFI